MFKLTVAGSSWVPGIHSTLGADYANSRKGNKRYRCKAHIVGFAGFVERICGEREVEQA